MSDIFGRKACLLFAYTVFGLGCLFCGLARNMTDLIIARAISGLGAGGMTTVVSIMMSDIVTLRERGTWQGILNIVYASGAGFGAPIGGLFADYSSWRWAFLAQTPLCALAIVAVTFVLKLPSREVSDWKTKFRRIDFVGAFALVSTVFCLVFGMDRGANFKWRSLVAIIPLCLALPLSLLFFFIEKKFAEQPFAPPRIIFHRNLFPSYMCNFSAFGGWLALMFYLPLYYQAVDQTTASQAGVRLIPGIAASVTGSLSAGIVMQKTGRYYWLTVAAYTMTFISYIPILLFSGYLVNNLLALTIGFCFNGLGGGIGVTTILTSAIANSSSEDQAVATAGTYLFRALGSTIGVSLSASIVQQSLRMQLRKQLQYGKDADKIVRKVRESLDYVNTLEPELEVLVRESYGAAVRHSFLLMMSLAFVTLVSSCEFVKFGDVTVR